MRWLVMISLVVVVDGNFVCGLIQRAGNSGRLPIYHDVDIPGAKGYVPIPTWEATPVVRRPAWLFKYTLTLNYIMLLADVIGAMGCLAAHERSKAQRWLFGLFLCLCACVKVASIVALFDAPVREIGVLIWGILSAPSLCSGYLLPLLFFNWWFGTKAACDLKPEADE